MERCPRLSVLGNVIGSNSNDFAAVLVWRVDHSVFAVEVFNGIMPRFDGSKIFVEVETIKCVEVYVVCVCVASDVPASVDDKSGVFVISVWHLQAITNADGGG